MHPIPDGLVLGVPAGVTKLARSHLLSLGGRARAALEPLVPRGHPDPDNLGALIRHRFGPEVLDRLVDPLVGSINAGDTMHLSLAATAPQVAAGVGGSRSLLLGMRRQRRTAQATSPGTQPSSSPPEPGCSPWSTPWPRPSPTSGWCSASRSRPSNRPTAADGW